MYVYVYSMYIVRVCSHVWNLLQEGEAASTATQDAVEGVEQSAAREAEGSRQETTTEPSSNKEVSFCDYM